MAKEKILIVGGGFGGIKTALELSSDKRFAVTLLSDRPDFQYYPSLYRVATGGKVDNALIPLTNIFKGKDVHIVQGKAASLDRQARTVRTEQGDEIPYDTLVLALGVVTNFFGIKGLDQYAYGIKSRDDVTRFKSHLHKQLTNERRPDLNYVIIGGGPTGIELAGALPAYLKQIMQNHGIKQRAIHIDLIEAAPRLLPRLPRDTAVAVRRRLRHLGVKLYLNQTVQGETADELTVNGKAIRSHTVVWTAGVTNNPFFSQNNFALTKRGKVACDVYLQAEDNIFVIGDNANSPYSGMAQTAIYDGEFVSRNIKRRSSGKEFKSYKPKRPTTVIPVGEHWAAMVRGKLHAYGRLGWLLREAADFAGFLDYEALKPASKQWLTEFGGEEKCAVCLMASLKR